MNIVEKKILIRDLVKGYADNKEKGVRAYGGKLEVRPPYQREFVYKDEQRDAVINTIFQNFPLNILYWVDREDGEYEVLDGQQRIISICQYHNNEFIVTHPNNNRYNFHKLPHDIKKKFLNYPLVVYFCTGEPSEKIAWFRVINVAGEPLNDQEILNAVHHGAWVSDAKIRFSKFRCAAQDIGSNYVNGSAIRQDYLRTAIEWIKGKETIEDYMLKQSDKKYATELWSRFENVINWVKSTFTEYRKEMKGIDWGTLYAEHKDKDLDPKKLEKRIKKLMKDEDIESKKGIYSYVLTENRKHLNLRAFTNKERRELYEKLEDGKCPRCGKKKKFEEMEADHITPWSEGGATRMDNAQMLCVKCNREKSNK